MKVLLVKTSSIGDLIHTMPAITDAMSERPGIAFDWLVEEGLAPVCRWHPAIDNVITVSYRYWRKYPLKGMCGGHLSRFRRRLRSTYYDLIIDAQGLYKSAVMTAFATGEAKHGFDLASCREKLAPLAYDHRHNVPRRLHAVERLRLLFALSLGYPAPQARPNFGIDRSRFPRPDFDGRYVLCLHGSKWRTKQWPLARWRGMAELAANTGLKVCLPWFDPADNRRAALIAQDLPNVVPAKTDLEQIGRLIAHAECVVTMETGLGHLSAAIGVPTVTLYGPTSQDTHGMTGTMSVQCLARLPCSPCYNKLCNLTLNARAPAPCMKEIHQSEVWHKATSAMAARSERTPADIGPNAADS